MTSQATLLQGDCADLLRDIPDGSVDAIITDIPYAISKPGVKYHFKGKSKPKAGQDFGEWDYGFDVASLAPLARVLRKGGAMIVFHSFFQTADLKSVMEANGLVWKNLVAWEKTNPWPLLRDRRYVGSMEIASWLVRPGRQWVFNRLRDNFQSQVFRFPNRTDRRVHPTQKPVALMSELVRIHTEPGALVLDPFMGSGSTGVACMETGRRFIGMERDPVYYAAARERMGVADAGQA